MGFWSKLGKVAKVAAPFALDFVPGGQLVHLGLAAGLGAATTKGGVKKRLLGGAIGAGSEYAGNVLKGGKFNPLASGKRGASSLLGGAPGAVAAKAPTSGLADNAFEQAPDFSKVAGTFGNTGLDTTANIADTIYGSGKNSPLTASLTHPDLGTPGVNMPGMKPPSNLLGKFGSYAKDNPMLMLSLASILGGAGGDDGGGGGGNGRRGYDPKGFANPEDSLSRALQASHRLGQGMLERGPRNFSALLPAQGPAPVNIAGVQIGGGLHTPEQLTHDQSIDAFGDLNKYDPFQSVGGVEKMKSQPRRT